MQIDLYFSRTARDDGILFYSRLKVTLSNWFALQAFKMKFYSIGPRRLAATRLGPWSCPRQVQKHVLFIWSNRSHADSGWRNDWLRFLFCFLKLLSATVAASFILLKLFGFMLQWMTFFDPLWHTSHLLLCFASTDGAARIFPMSFWTTQYEPVTSPIAQWLPLLVLGSWIF